MKKITLPSILILSTFLSACGSSSEEATSVESTPKTTTTTTTTVTERSANLESYLWAFDAESTIRSTAVINNNIAYFATNAGKVFALNTTDGSEVWQQQLNGRISGDLLYAENKIFLLSKEGIFYALNSETGVTEWQISTPGEMSIDEWDYFTNSPIIHDNKIYLASTSGVIFVLDINDGSEVTSYTLDGKLRGKPAIVENNLFIASRNGVFSINLNDGSENWYFAKSVPTSPQVDSGVLSFGSRDNEVTGLDANTGESLWRVSHGTSWVTGKPLAHNGTFYIGSSDDARFQSIDATTGDINWSIGTGKNVFSKPLIVDGVVYMTSGDAYGNPGTGYIKAIALDGTFLWSLAGSNFMSSPVVNDATLFLGSDDGFFYAIATAQ
jgi:outer membrane protein assembly factor BamB